ncbi:MAG: hypothetical protein U1E60_24470 [Reyranellaceae bacterium]
MPLLTYDDTRRAAKRIVEALTIGHMPPWYAEPGIKRYVSGSIGDGGEIPSLGGRSSFTLFRTARAT